MKADTVVLLPPVPELLTYVVDVMHGNVLQQLLIHCPVKTLNLALGLRMPDPSVDRQDIQLREQTFELRAALLEAGKTVRHCQKESTSGDRIAGKPQGKWELLRFRGGMHCYRCTQAAR